MGKVCLLLNIVTDLITLFTVVMSSWKQLQLAVNIPERTISISKGRPIKVKVCQRCGKLKDRQGSVQNHPRDNCSDGFPIWNRVPFPLPRGLGQRLIDSPGVGNKKIMSVDRKMCLRFFKLLVDCLAQQADGIPTTLSIEMQNLQVFEALARRDSSMSLAQAVLKGIDAYTFDPHRFKK